MRNVALATALAAGTLFCTPALSATYPYRHHQEQEIDRHQVGVVDVLIESVGKGRIDAFFSNGRQIAGNILLDHYAPRKGWQSDQGRPPREGP
jgi:hypothetical protein